MWDHFKKLHPDTASAIFIIIFAAVFILTNLLSGFSLGIFIFTMLVGSLIAFFYPKSGLLAILFLTFVFERFFALQSIFIGEREIKFYPLDIIFIAAILGTLWLIKRGKIKFQLKKIDFWLIGFIGLGILYFLVSIFVLKTDLGLSVSSFKTYCFYPLFYFLTFVLINKKQHLKRFLKFGLAGAVAILIFVAYGLLAGQGLWAEHAPLTTEGSRLLAFTHAFFLSLAFLTAFSFVAFKKNISKRNLYLLLLALWGFGILGSMMRHLWISILVSLFLTLFLIPKNKRKELGDFFGKSLLGMAIFLLVIFYVSFLLPNSQLHQAADYSIHTLERRVHYLFNFSEDKSLSWRAIVWHRSFQEYLKSPILGIGFGKTVYLQVSQVFKDFVEVRNIHNSPLTILIQMGLVSFLVFSAFIYKNIKKLFKKAAKSWVDIMLFALLMNYLIAFLFQTYLETNMLAIFLWIILGLIRAQKIEAKNPSA